MKQDPAAVLPMDNQAYERDLGDGLRLRWSTPEELDRLGAMYCNVFRPKEAAPPNPIMGHWIRDMTSGRHPHITGYDFAVVDDTRTERIVAATCLLANRARYANIPFMMGRPEIVATEIPYRNRHLQRAIFALIHARGAARVGSLHRGRRAVARARRKAGPARARTRPAWRDRSARCSGPA